MTKKEKMTRRRWLQIVSGMILSLKGVIMGLNTGKGGNTPSKSPKGIGERPNLKASDVVFMYRARDPALYEIYSGTIVGWAGRARSHREEDVRWFRRQVDEAQRRGLLYCGSVDFVVDFANFIEFRPNTFMDAVCRDLDGNPITVPWLWDHRHKGHPVYWFCTNNPDYQAYLLDQADRACCAPIDGLHIDDWRGTSACSAWNGGCFCRFCREGFREWLRQRLTPEQLRSLGISDIEGFDLQAFLKARGVTAEQWRRQRAELPLGELFQGFQTERMMEVVREVFEHAESLVGKPLLRSVNSSASSPEAISIAPLIDYFCGEMEHGASAGEVPVEPAFVFRLVEGLGKRQAATASGHNWAWIAANDKPNLVRTWIAQAYAFGNLFMVPHHQWCYTPEKGTHWWEGKPDDFAFLYRFVREKAPLLDGYRSLGDVGLVYTHANFGEIRSAALELLRANLPFALLIAEPNLGVSLAEEDLAPYDLLLAGERPLPSEFERLAGKAGKRIVRWRGFETLPDTIRRSVIVEGSDKVRVSIRYRPGESEAPVVCHLLNQDYDVRADSVRPVDVTVRISRHLMRKAMGRDPKEGILHPIGGSPRDIPLEINGGEVGFNLNDLGLWTIVELK